MPSVSETDDIDPPSLGSGRAGSSEIELKLFGGFHLDSTSGTLPDLPRKAKALVAFLALGIGRPHSRDSLAALLWEDGDAAQARTSLRQALTAIRRSLAAERSPLTTDAESVALEPGTLRVDAQEFEHLLREATPSALEQAVALYQGDLLHGFHARAPAFEDWLRVQRERLRNAALQAMSRLLDHHQEQGRLDQAADMAMRLLALDPLQEDTHRALMRLYVRQGKPAEALRQYQRCREVLGSELRVPPDPQTEALYRDILQQRRLRAGAAPSAGAAAPEIEELVAPSPDPAPVPASQQLRQATLLLIDLSGFTAFVGEADPEEVHDFLSRYRAMVQGLVVEHGGSITNYIGARVMAVFGAPLAYGNDPERAVRAALAMREAVPKMAAGGRRFQPQIGVASGQVLAAQDVSGITISGEPVSLAARIMEGTPPGEVRVSDPVRQALVDQLDAQYLPHASVRAVSKPLVLWQVRGWRSGGSAMRPLVGRHPERMQLSAILDVRLRSETGQVVLVRGEAGIGKSRLMEEFFDLARARGFSCHRALIFDFGRKTEATPVRALIQGLLGIAPGAHEEVQRERVERALAAHPALGELRPFLEDLLSLPHAESSGGDEVVAGAERQRAQQEVLAALLRVRSAEEPLLILVEDIHWAEPQTLAHLAQAAAALRQCRGLLAMTTRAERDPIGAAWRAAAGACPFTTIDLGPLSEDEAMEYAIGYALADPAFARSCVQRAEGNPLFLDQLLRSASSDGGHLPLSVQSIVLAQMDRLPAADRQAAQAAAVLGPRYSLAALRDLIGDAGYECAALEACAMVRPEGRDYLFVHALIRDAVYASIIKSRRRELHRQAAQWYAERDAGLQAEHLDAAEDPAAASAYMRAAQSEAGRHHHDRALHLVARGGELAGSADPLRHDLYCMRGDLLRELGEVDASLAAFRQALELAKDDAQGCRAWLGIAAGLRILDRYEEALAAVDQAERFALSSSDSAQLAQLYFLRGNLHFPLGNTDACLAAHERARTYALQADSPLLEARALGSLGDAYYLRGHMLTAHEYFADCVELCRTHQLARIEAGILPMLALTWFYLNQIERALACCERARELGKRTGDLRATLIAHDVTMELHFYAGDIANLRLHAERTLELSRRLGARRFECDARLALALACYLRGEREAAAAQMEDVLPLSMEVARTYCAPRVLGALALATRDDSRREWALQQAEALLAEGSISHNHLHFYGMAMEVALRRRDPALLQHYADALEHYTGEQPLPWGSLLIARARALARHGAGERSAALREELTTLRDQARLYGFKPMVPRLDAALAA